MTRTIALFQHHPECSIDCCNGMIAALSGSYDVKLWSEEQCNDEFFKEYDNKEFESCDLKIILLGDSAVGKSKLVERFLIND